MALNDFGSIRLLTRNYWEQTDSLFFVYISLIHKFLKLDYRHEEDEDDESCMQTKNLYRLSRCLLDVLEKPIPLSEIKNIGEITMKQQLYTIKHTTIIRTRKIVKLVFLAIKFRRRSKTVYSFEVLKEMENNKKRTRMRKIGQDKRSKMRCTMRDKGVIDVFCKYHNFRTKQESRQV